MQPRLGHGRLHHSLVMDVIDAMSVDHRRDRLHHLIVDVIKFLSCEFLIPSNTLLSINLMTLTCVFCPQLSFSSFQILQLLSDRISLLHMVVDS